MFTICLFAAGCAIGGALVPVPKHMSTSEGAFRCRTADLATKVEFLKDAALLHEGYRLKVTPEKIQVWSADDAGAFYAVRTLEQLADKTYVPDSKYAEVKRRESDYVIPSATIEDAPTFRWRGLMIDEARHFLGKEAVMKQIDLMAIQYQMEADKVREMLGEQNMRYLESDVKMRNAIQFLYDNAVITEPAEEAEEKSEEAAE